MRRDSVGGIRQGAADALQAAKAEPQEDLFRARLENLVEPRHPLLRLPVLPHSPTLHGASENLVAWTGRPHKARHTSTCPGTTLGPQSLASRRRLPLAREHVG